MTCIESFFCFIAYSVILAKHVIIGEVEDNILISPCIQLSSLPLKHHILTVCKHCFTSLSILLLLTLTVTSFMKETYSCLNSFSKGKQFLSLAISLSCPLQLKHNFHRQSQKHGFEDADFLPQGFILRNKPLSAYSRSSQKRLSVNHSTPALKSVFTHSLHLNILLLKIMNTNTDMLQASQC